jgi:hypothetical protein
LPSLIAKLGLGGNEFANVRRKHCSGMRPTPAFVPETVVLTVVCHPSCSASLH